MSKWDVRFLRLAHEVAKWSKDRSTRVGAVIVGEDRTPGPYGYNGFPRYVDDEREERHARPENNAARVGMALKGCTIYVTHIPCVDCTRAIIQVGMRQIIVDEGCLADGGFKERWGEHEKTTKEMLDEASVELSFVPVPAGNEDD